MFGLPRIPATIEPILPIPANLLVWFDCSDIRTLFQNSSFTTPVTANAQTIGGVTDKSGNNFAMANGSLAYSSADITKPSAKGTNSSYLHSSASFATFSAVTIYIVAKITGDNQGLYEINVNDGVNTGFSIFASSSSINFRWVLGSSITSTQAINGYPITDCFTYLWDGANVSGFVRQTQSTPQATGSISNTPNNHSLGALGGATFGLTGDIGELLVYSVAHSASQRALVWGYLGRKWSL